MHPARRRVPAEHRGRSTDVRADRRRRSRPRPRLHGLRPTAPPPRVPEPEA